MSFKYVSHIIQEIVNIMLCNFLETSKNMSTDCLEMFTLESQYSHWHSLSESKKSKNWYSRGVAVTVFPKLARAHYPKSLILSKKEIFKKTYRTYNLFDMCKIQPTLIYVKGWMHQKCNFFLTKHGHLSQCARMITQQSYRKADISITV